jgi:hypothetical protein
VSILINLGENNATQSSEDDDNLSSEFDNDFNDFEEIEPQEIDETIDEAINEELPDIDFKD